MTNPKKKAKIEEEKSKGVMDLLKIYKTAEETNKMEEIKEFQKGSWVNLVNPSENEITKILV